MLNVLSSLTCLVGVALIVAITGIYIVVGGCDLIQRMGEVALFAIIPALTFAAAGAMDVAEEAEEGEDEAV